ncbi:glycosyltransferase family 2 protein [Cognatishimia sp. MH4019]|uniref:glycosyltransferase family 2 protein n=1 Tax=Cognatishimia sp. MH4019 TaxID=2854030 RepID=UPI001CD64627|nr:glycosyltransferase family 2 protein [Cognatishimia sp. MH4019]
MNRYATLLVIPCLNEEAYLPDLLESLLTQSLAREIWVVDGGSTDRSCQIVADMARITPRVRLLHNPGVTQASGVNMAAQDAQARGYDILIRVDAHELYPANFVETLVDTMIAREADSVTVPMIATRRVSDPWQRAAADLQRGWLGHGGALHRKRARSGWVRHGHHAAFRLDRFLALGGYDPAFIANEDVEYDERLIAAGGRIWMERKAAIRYFPRRSPRALFRQMQRNGRWRLQTARKHHRSFGLRQNLPVIATLLLLLSLPSALILHPAAALPALGYLLLILLLSARCGRSSLRVAWLAMLSHIGFGLGVLGAMFKRSPQVRRS